MQRDYFINRFRLAALNAVLVLGLLIGVPRPVQGNTLKLEVIYSTIVGIEGNVVRLAGGYSVDLSEAKFEGRSFELSQKPEIRVGDVIQVSGTVISKPGDLPMIKAATAQVQTGKEFYFEGFVQDVNERNNTITFLNQKVTVASNAVLMTRKGKLIRLKSIKPGNDIYVTGVGLSTGLVASEVFRVNDPEGPLNEVIAYVKSVNGTVIELEGGFKIDIAKILKSIEGPGFELFKNPAFYGPGTEILFTVREKTAEESSTGILQVDGAFGFTKAPISIHANLQSVDPVERTITVLNQKIFIPENTIIQGPRSGRISLEQLVVGQSISVYGSIGENGLVLRFLSQVFVN
jgi:hypothetical protein